MKRNNWEITTKENHFCFQILNFTEQLDIIRFLNVALVLRRDLIVSQAGLKLSVAEDALGLRLQSAGVPLACAILAR